MGELVDISDLVGTVEIADRLGLSRSTLVHDWRRRYEDFPPPMAVISSVYIWRWQDVKAWAQQTGRLGS